MVIEYLDTLAKIFGGAISAIAGGWATGILARRRVLQRNLRAIKQELSLIQNIATDTLPLIRADAAVAAEGKHVSQTIRRLPTVSLTAASTTGAFDHLQKSELPEKIRQLLVAASAVNEGIIHRELMLSSTGIYQTGSRARVSNNIAALLEAAQVAARDLAEAIANLGPLEGGKRVLGV